MELQPSSESVEACLGSTLEVNCTTFTQYLLWETTPECFSFYNNQNSELVGVVRTFCDFEVVLLSTSPLMSTATLSNVSYAHNGTVLACWNTVVQLTRKEDQMVNITIFVREGNVQHNVISHLHYCIVLRKIAFYFNNWNSYFLGPPSTPLSPAFSPQSLTSAVLSWTPNYADCVVKYTITLSNITEGNVSYTYNTATDTTSVTVSDLTQGATYSFFVAGVDTLGSVGEESVSSETLIFDG